MGQIEILVGQIVPAGKAHRAVDDGDFPVVPVVHEHVEHRDDRVEHPALYPRLHHAADEVPVDKADAADIIVEEADLHSLGSLPGEHILQPPEGRALLYGVVFHKNEPLRLFQIPQLSLQPVGGVAVKRHVRVPEERIARKALEIARQIARHGVPGLQLLHRALRPGGHSLLQRPIHRFKPPGHSSGGSLTAHQQIKAHAQHRKRQQEQHPRHFKGRVDMLSVQPQHNHQCRQAGNHAQNGRILVEPDAQQDNPQYLQENTQAHKHQAAYAVLYAGFLLGCHTTPSLFSPADCQARRWYFGMIIPNFPADVKSRCSTTRSGS